MGQTTKQKLDRSRSHICKLFCSTCPCARRDRSRRGLHRSLSLQSRSSPRCCTLHMHNIAVEEPYGDID